MGRAWIEYAEGSAIEAEAFSPLRAARERGRSQAPLNGDVYYRRNLDF